MFDVFVFFVMILFAAAGVGAILGIIFSLFKLPSAAKAGWEEGARLAAKKSRFEKWLEAKASKAEADLEQMKNEQSSNS